MKSEGIRKENEERNGKIVLDDNEETGEDIDKNINAR